MISSLEFNTCDHIEENKTLDPWGSTLSEVTPPLNHDLNHFVLKIGPCVSSKEGHNN